MKKCPTCGKEFEDSMRFCQVDGSELVADEPEFDPYATMVARRDDIAPEDQPKSSAVEQSKVAEPTADEAGVEHAGPPADAPRPIAEPDDVLDLPEKADPLKTMYVSEAELHAVLGEEGKASATHSEEPVMEIPDAPSPPPSPFSAPEGRREEPAPFAPPFEEQATLIQPAVSMPFDEPAPVAEWTPPPAPDMSRQQDMAPGVPFQSSTMGAAGQSKGLAMASMICGVLSCLCCISVLTGPAAIVMGFIAKNKADQSPSEFGGRGLALAGIITGAIGLLLGIVLIILQVFFGVLGGLMGNVPR